jgi:protein-S-isoprenylcysteine O-methyltransferase Ste14
MLWTTAKVAIVVSVLAWCALRLRVFDGYIPFGIPSAVRPVGVVLIGFGGMLVLSCGMILSSRGILAKPGDRLFPKEFVADGPFRYVRNPMSLGVVVLFGGLGLFERSPSILILALTLFLILHAVAFYVEEPGLEKRFGDSYRHYKESTNRWIPRFPRPAA